MNKIAIVLAKAVSIMFALGVCGYLIWGAQTAAQAPSPGSKEAAKTAAPSQTDAGPANDGGVFEAPEVLMPSTKSGVLHVPAERPSRRLEVDPRPPGFLHSTKVIIVDTPPPGLDFGAESQPTSRPTGEPTSQPKKTPTSQPTQSPTSQPAKSKKKTQVPSKSK